MHPTDVSVTPTRAPATAVPARGVTVSISYRPAMDNRLFLRPMVDAGSRPVADGLPRWWTVGFSGHRHLAQPDLVAGKLADVIQRLSQRNPWLAGIASAAAGADTLFGEEMLRRQHPMTIVLPCPTSRFREDFTDPSTWIRAEAIIQAAISVELLPSIADARVPGARPETPNAPGHSRDAQYMEAGIRTADRSDVFVAVWDGQPARGPGGTGDIVRYVRGIGLPLVLINPLTGAIAEERFDTLPEASQGPGTTIDNPRRLVERHFETLNLQAKACAPAVRQLVRTSVWLHLIAATLAAAALVFQPPTRTLVAVAILEVLVLAAAVTLLAVRERRHRQWLQLRTEAEVCRSFLATWDIQRHAGGHHHFISTLPGMSRLYASLQLLGRLDRGPSKTLEEVRDAYADDRVLAQLVYFERARTHARGQYKRRRSLTILCTAGALMTSALLAMVLVTGRLEHAKHWLEFFATTLPLVATACGVLLITDESARRYMSYGEMTALLNHLLLRVNGTRSWESLGRIAGGVEDVLLQEILEWRSFVRHTEHLH